MNPKLRHQLLCDFIGIRLPAENAVAHADLKSVFHRAFGSLGLANRFQESTLVDAWPALVGPTLAPHCSPGVVRRGVLLVKVDHPAWLHQITMGHKADILAAVQKQFPHLKIQDLHLRIG